MKQNIKTTILVTSLILMAFIACGVIGYLNDSGRVSPTTAETDNTLPTDIPAEIDLAYCFSPASLCVISFGRDNADNMLIIVKNNIPDLAEFYTKIKQTDSTDLYSCQKVQFTSDIYYCLGKQISDGTTITMDIYSKNNDRLVASGSLLVSLEGTPAPITTKIPTGATSTSATKVPTGTASTSATKVPTGTTSPTVTQPPTLYP
jgi:hypothetical protein